MFFFLFSSVQHMRYRGDCHRADVDRSEKDGFFLHNGLSLLIFLKSEEFDGD